MALFIDIWHILESDIPRTPLTDVGIEGSIKSKFSVLFLKTDPRARYQGYTFFFREGFCWNNVLNPLARLLKARIKAVSVNDVGAMSLYSIYNSCPNLYLVAALNSEFLFIYYREFVNCTVNIQINDIRQLPIIIPNKEQLSFCKELFDNIIELKRKELSYSDPQKNIAEDLNIIEKELDKFVCELYSI